VDGHVVLADGQRAGRGSHGRSWDSPPGLDLYLSIVARPRLALAALPPLTLAVGLGVAEAVEGLVAPVAALRAAVKWPNDVWLSGHKCAGILVETSSAPAAAPAAEPEGGRAVVIGIGLNVNRREWPQELRASATSLRAATSAAQPFDRGRCLAALLQAVEAWVERLVSAGGEAVAAALQDRLALRGERVRCGDTEGVLQGVAPSGAVRIATASGVRELLAGRLFPASAAPER
jgi:BirA family biotin operon repressor/biotin-[acetyl-CoA-carboxylase] ligase